jgi:hypothetical protein
MSSFWDTITNTVGSASDLLKEAAQTYDTITGKSANSVQTGGITAPAQTTGVDTTAGTTAAGMDTSTLMVVGVVVVVLFLAMSRK